MKKTLISYFRAQMFRPGFVGLFTNPFYFARRGLWRAMMGFSRELRGDLLDVGCGSKPYAAIIHVSSYTGLDIDSPATRQYGVADHLYDGKSFPYDDDRFDSALCNQVLEHIFNPDEFLREIYRVMKPGGRLVLTVPFVWDEHEQPYDYARYSSFGLDALLEKNGFRILEHNKLGADATVLFQLVNAYLFKITKSWVKIARLFFTVTVIAGVNLLGALAGKILPRNPDLFLDHAVLVEKTVNPY